MNTASKTPAPKTAPAKGKPAAAKPAPAKVAPVAKPKAAKPAKETDSRPQSSKLVVAVLLASAGIKDNAIAKGEISVKGTVPKTADPSTLADFLANQDARVGKKPAAYWRGCLTAYAKKANVTLDQPERAAPAPKVAKGKPAAAKPTKAAPVKGKPVKASLLD